jgi:Ca2+-binding RTX toxin-like protein
MESLDSRRLMSTAFLSDGILTVIGNDSADSIVLTKKRLFVTVTINPSTYNFLNSSISQINIFAGGGSDVVRTTDAGFGLLNTPMYISGGSGDDLISCANGDDTVCAGDGEDTLYGWGGDDELYGEDDSDYLNGGDDDDYLDGGRDRQKDYLTGDDGCDTFVNTEHEYSYGTYLEDKTMDYSSAEDELETYHMWH